MKKLLVYISSVLIALFSLNAISNHNSPESLEARVSAVGTLNVGGASAAVAEESATMDGESVYNTACAACHSAGIGGAPAVGDNASWVDRIAQGMEQLNEHAIQGFTGNAGMMPAKGGNPSLSDAAVTAAVQYMVDQSQ